jgi:hypothetical protein
VRGIGRSAVGAVLVCALAVFGLASCTSSKTAAKDVSIRHCTADPGGGQPKASGGITNHSSKASTYAIHVEFDDSSGNRVSDGAAAVGRVDAGGTAQWQLTGVQDAKGPLKCTLESVTRTVAP